MIQTAKWEDENIPGKGKKLEQNWSYFFYVLLFVGFKYKHLAQAHQEKILNTSMIKCYFYFRNKKQKIIYI